MCARKHTFIFVAGSFSTTSGGRTAATFRRAKLFKEMGHDVFIATSNLRPTYADIFSMLCDKYELEGVELLNLYDHYCEGGLYELAGLPDPDNGFSERETISSRGELLKRSLLDARGRVYRTIWFRENQDATRRALDIDDVELPEDELAVNFRTAGRGCESAPICRIECFDPASGRTYLTMEPGLDNRLRERIWHRRDGSVLVFADKEHLDAFWFAQLAERYEDVIFMEEDHAAMPALLNNPYSSRLKVVGTIHSTFFIAPYGYGSGLRPYLKPLLEHMQDYAAIVCITEQERVHVANYFGMRNNMFCIPNICDVPDTADLPKKELTAVVCTRLEDVKQVDHMIRVAALVASRIPEFRLLIYGQGSLKDELESLVDDLGASENIVFCGYTDKPLEVVAQGALSLSTSKYEGLPFSIYEALAVGTPVVSYDFLYGPRAFIENGVNGILVPPNNEKAMAEAIVDLFEHPARLERMSREARNLNPVYSLESIQGRWEGLFEYVDTADNCPLSRYSFIVEAAVIGEADLRETLGFGRNVAVSVRVDAWGRPTAYYLNFMGAKRIDICDQLYLEGNVASTEGDVDTVLFSSTMPDVEMCAILEDVQEIRLYVCFGKYACYRSLWPTLE